MKILIADDQPMLLKTLEIKFVKEGYEVVTTTNFQDAINIISTQSIDVVLSEVSLSNSKNFEILKAAKLKDYNIVAIIISIHSLEQTIIEAFESGAEEYLIKPVNLNILSVRIRKLLKVRKMREVLAKSIPASERQNILKQLSSMNPMLESENKFSGHSSSLKGSNVSNVNKNTLLHNSTIDADELTEKTNNYSDEHIENEKEERVIKNVKTFQHRLLRSLKEFIVYFSLFLGFFLIARLVELGVDYYLHGAPKLMGKVVAFGILKDILFCMHVGFFLFIIYELFSFISYKVAKVVFVILSVCIIVLQIALSQYFLTTLVPLGADLWNYSFADISQTVNASGGIKPLTILLFIVSIIVMIISFASIPKKIRISYLFSIIAFSILFLSLFFDSFSLNQYLMPGKEYSNNLSINKSWYFYNASWNHFFESRSKDLYTMPPKVSANDSIGAGGIQFNYVDPVNFPFLHTIDTTRDVLSPFFKSSPTAPNIVIILVEGLGRAFTNKGAYLGNFTPFLDSLSDHSLYWQNFLSEGGRTFAVLPSVIGSLPFNKTGFNDMSDKMPSHISLLSILNKNGYNTSFYYGGDSHFDYMNTYLKKNNVSNIYDESTYPSSYVKMPGSESGFSWGYGDKELFRRYFETKQNINGPFASILLTVSTHSPFIVNDEEGYLKKFESRLNELKFDEGKKNEARNYKNEYASIIFMDEAIRGFINEYKQRADFANTIFIITGDHRMPEIPMSTKLDRYHVPLIIYSPLLASASTFASVSTHFDITPSVSILLHNKYNLKIPTEAQWMGGGLDTSTAFRNIHSYPFKQVKNEDLSDFMKEEYFLNDINLFRIYKSMDIEPENNVSKQSEVKNALDDFKRRNDMFILSGKLIPDSLAIKWGSK